MWLWGLSTSLLQELHPWEYSLVAAVGRGGSAAELGLKWGKDLIESGSHHVKHWWSTDSTTLSDTVLPKLTAGLAPPRRLRSWIQMIEEISHPQSQSTTPAPPSTLSKIMKPILSPMLRGLLWLKSKMSLVELAGIVLYSWILLPVFVYHLMSGLTKYLLLRRPPRIDKHLDNFRFPSLAKVIARRTQAGQERNALQVAIIPIYRTWMHSLQIKLASIMLSGPTPSGMKRIIGDWALHSARRLERRADLEMLNSHNQPTQSVRTMQEVTFTLRHHGCIRGLAKRTSQSEWTEGWLDAHDVITHSYIDMCVCARWSRWSCWSASVKIREDDVRGRHVGQIACVFLHVCVGSLMSSTKLIVDLFFHAEGFVITDLKTRIGAEVLDIRERRDDVQVLRGSGQVVCAVIRLCAFGSGDRIGGEVSDYSDPMGAVKLQPTKYNPLVVLGDSNMATYQVSCDLYALAPVSPSYTQMNTHNVARHGQKPLNRLISCQTIVLAQIIKEHDYQGPILVPERSAALPTFPSAFNILCVGDSATDVVKRAELMKQLNHLGSVFLLEPKFKYMSPSQVNTPMFGALCISPIENKIFQKSQLQSFYNHGIVHILASDPETISVSACAECLVCDVCVSRRDLSATRSWDDVCKSIRLLTFHIRFGSQARTKRLMHPNFGRSSWLHSPSEIVINLSPLIFSIPWHLVLQYL